MAKSDPEPTPPKDAPPPSPAPAPARDLQSDLDVTTQAILKLQSQKADLRMALKSWLDLHGERCPCTRCTSGRLLLDVTA